MSMQYGAVEYTPSSPNGNWTSLCQIAAQARSVGYAADRPGSELGDSTIPNFAYLRDLWEGEVDVPDIGALYKNNQTTYPTDFMNNPASYMAGTKYFDAASQWYPSLQQDGGSGANTDFLSDYFFSGMQTKLGLTDEGEVDWSTALSGSSLRTASSLLRLRCILRLRGLRIPLRRMATEARSILFTIWRTSVLATTVGAVRRNPVRAQQRRMLRRHLALLQLLI